LEISAQPGEGLPEGQRRVQQRPTRLRRHRVHQPATRPGAGTQRGVRKLVIIGTGDSAITRAALACGAAGDAGRCIAVIDTRAPNRAAHQSLRLLVTGAPVHAPGAELREAADEFVLAFAPEDAHHAVSALSWIVSQGMDFRVMPETMGCVYPLLRRLGWAEVPVVCTRLRLRHALARVWKRVTDVVVAASTFALLLPLMALVAVAIRVDTPGPVIFTQDRVGKNGRIFRMLKFRTMVAGAHLHEARMTADCSADQRFVKIDCDPRVTRLGQILRKTSVDELPQLWNVLRGEMSLVGPRPSQPSEVEHYEPEHFVRLLTKPGVTGMWQVSGRSGLCFEDAVKLDSIYEREQNPLLDLKIMFKTVAVVLRCRGAC
jgi:lipopolysaccharide/colanic/teichoic acid biosynthesis glycosyltransferase